MIIPWGTDAPIYHRPIATVSVMIACVAVFVVDPYSRHVEHQLALGDGLHPMQWVTHMFIHQGIGHLLGNMLFLWAFGLIVEGKLGAIGFLLAYLAMGMFNGAVVQACYRPDDVVHAMGASAAIFGLMSLCLLWAPRNDLYCLVILGGMMRLLVFQPEVPILWFAAFYIIWDVVKVGFWSMMGMAWIGGIGHALGALGGLILGTLLLKLDLVDCEGWDLFSRMKHGRMGTMHRTVKKRPQRSLAERVQKKVAKAKKARAAGEAPDVVALRTLRGHLDAEETEAAMGFYRATRHKRPAWRPPDPERIDLIKALVAVQWWEDAAGVMQAYLDESRLPAPKIRLKLAEVLIRRLDRPVAGLRTLERLPVSDLPANLAEGRRKLVAMAQHLQDEGTLELDDPVQAI